MTKNKKNTRRGTSSTPRHQGAFGSSPLRTKFKMSKRMYLFASILVVGIGVYAAATSSYFGLFDKNEDVEKGLVQASEVKESPAATTPPLTQDDRADEQSSPVAADAEAGIEGEGADTPVETNKMPEGEEAAIEKAAIVDTEIDNHEVEMLGGSN